MLTRAIRYAALGLLLLAGAGHAQRPAPEQEQAGASSLMTIPRTGERVPVPTSDAEVLRLLEYPEASLTVALQGLYQIYRRRGGGVLEAYIQTLRAWEQVQNQARMLESPRSKSP